MAGQYEVVYKAIADFSDLNRQSAQATQQLRQLEQQNAKNTAAANAEATSHGKVASALAQLSGVTQQATKNENDLALARARSQATTANVVVTEQKYRDSLVAVKNAAENAALSDAQRAEIVKKSALADIAHTNALRDAEKAMKDFDKATRTADMNPFISNLTRMSQTLNGVAGPVTSAIASLTMLGVKFATLGSVIAPVLTIVGDLVVALGGLVASAAPLAGVLAAIPQGISILGQGLGSLLLGLNGVSKAFGAYVSQQQAGAKASIQAANTIASNAHAIADAEHALQDAQFNSVQSQLALNNARQQAIIQLQQLQDQVKGAGLAEQQGNLGVAEAKQALQAALQNPNSSSTDIVSARLAVESAQQSLTQTQQTNTNNRQQLRRQQNLPGGPIEGSQSVVSASHAESEAVYSVAQAEYALQQAIKTQNQEAITGATAYQQALANLTPAQKQFVQYLQGIYPIFKQLKEAAGPEGLFHGLEAGINNLLKLLPVVEPILTKTSDLIGKLVENFTKNITTPKWLDFFKDLGNANLTDMTLFEKSLVNIANALRGITTAAEPMGERLANMFDNMTARWSAFVNSTKGQNDLTRFFKETTHELSLWGGLLHSFADMLVAVFGPSRKDLGDGIVKSLTDTFNGWTKWAHDNKGTLNSFFDGVYETTKQIGDFLDKIGNFFGTIMSNNQGNTQSFLKLLGALMGPLATFIDALAKNQGALKEILTNLGIFAEAMLPFVDALVKGGIVALEGLTTVLAKISKNPIGRDVIDGFLGLAIGITAVAKASEGYNKISNTVSKAKNFLTGNKTATLPEQMDAAGVTAGKSIAEQMIAAGQVVAREINEGMVQDELPFGKSGSADEPGQGALFGEGEAKSREIPHGPLAEMPALATDGTGALVTEEAGGSAGFFGKLLASIGLGGSAGEGGAAAGIGLGSIAGIAGGGLLAAGGIVSAARNGQSASGKQQAMSAGQGAIGGALLGGTIGSIVPGIGTLAGAGVGAAIGGGVPLIIDNFSKIKSAASDLINWLEGQFPGLSGGFSKVWNDIEQSATVLWTALKDIFNFGLSVLTTVWNAWGSTITKFLEETWSNIKEILTGVFKVIEGLFDIFTGILTGNWGKVWDGFKEIFSGAWDIIAGDAKEVWDEFKGIFELGAKTVSAIWSELWTGISETFSSAWKGIKAGISDAVSAMQSIWSGITDVFEAPVKFIVNTVINDGLIGNLNKVLSAIGIKDKIPTISFMNGSGSGTPSQGATPVPHGGSHGNALAMGGHVPGQGNSDTVPAMLTPGEFVIRKEAAAALGPRNLNALNGIQNKSIGGWITSGLGDVAGVGSGIFNTVKNVGRDATAEALKIAFSGIQKAMDNTLGDSLAAKVGEGTTTFAMNQILNWVKGKSSVSASGGSGGNFNGSTVGGAGEDAVWRNLLAVGYDPIAAAGIMGNLQTESGFDPFIIQGGGHSMNPADAGDGGYGLAQWTPGAKLIPLLHGAAPSVSSEVAALRSEYSPSNINHASSPYAAAMDFLSGFERPRNPDQPWRGTQADAIYNHYAPHNSRQKFATGGFVGQTSGLDPTPSIDLATVLDPDIVPTGTSSTGGRTLKLGDHGTRVEHLLNHFEAFKVTQQKKAYEARLRAWRKEKADARKAHTKFNKPEPKESIDRDVFSKSLENEVENWQHYLGHTATGKVSAAEYRNRVWHDGKQELWPLFPGMFDNKHVENIQRQLHTDKFYDGAYNGDYDRKTMNAVAQFQDTYGLKNTYAIDQNMYANLISKTPALDQTIRNITKQTKRDIEWNDYLLKIAQFGDKYAALYLLNQGQDTAFTIAQEAAGNRAKSAALNGQAYALGIADGTILPETLLQTSSVISGNNIQDQINFVSTIDAMHSTPTLANLSTALRAPDVTLYDLWLQSGAQMSKYISPDKLKTFLADLQGFEAGTYYGDVSGGTPVVQRATGGHVPGYGNTDSVRAMLTPGEFVLNKDAAAALGASNLDALNNAHKYATGGSVFGYMNDTTPAPAKFATGGAVQSLTKNGVSTNVTNNFNTTINNPIAERPMYSLSKDLQRKTQLGVL